ncbi:MAG: RidA family protein [Gemmatimonadetes bacterium]|nr:RidA family protein [Gemmatimonadota bacterium]
MDTVATQAAPAAIGPYSQAVTVGGMIYSAGQIALHPDTMELVGSDVVAQTKQVFANLEAVLEAAGSSLARVVKTTVYLADMADFPAMNEVYAARFGDHRPARSTVAVKTLPKNARVEIDLIALQG